ncbi:MAG: matrixin family metalloprotease [Bacteroidota bacterium]
MKNTDRENFLSRLKKVALHEIGHNIGLDHCSSTECFMRDAAETITTVDRVGCSLCEICKRNLDSGSL